MTDFANHFCAAYEKIPLCIEYIRSAPSQEEADEDVMDWQDGSVKTTLKLPATDPDESEQSGINEASTSHSGSDFDSPSKTPIKAGTKDDQEVDDMKKPSRNKRNSRSGRRSVTKADRLNNNSVAPPLEFRRYLSLFGFIKYLRLLP